MNRGLFFILFLLAVNACQSPPEFTKEDQQNVADSVRQTLMNYNSDINRSGLTAEFLYLDSSNDFFWVPPGYVAPITYDSVTNYIRQSAPLFRHINNTWDSLRVIPLTKELASYTGRLRSVMTDTSGRITSYFLIETGTMIKRTGGWKLLSGQTSLVE